MSRNAYATLITRASYLPGVILLAHSLKKHGSNYPLVVLYTSNLHPGAIKALEFESRHSNLVPTIVKPLSPGNNQQTYLIAARFADTWTKLRVFSEPLFHYEKVCYLDADMMIFNKNMDCVFDAVLLPDDDWLGACQICCCNLDHDAWAPPDWTPENCPFSYLQHPAAITRAVPVPKNGTGGVATHASMNGGMFIFKPSLRLWEELIQYFDANDHLGDMMFPDQDFLAEFFEDRWISMPWRFNALKTQRYWHPNIWRDDEVVCVHFIVDKPWATLIAKDGTAGYKGKDGETHRWWWYEYESWREKRIDEHEEQLVETVMKYVARPLGEEGSSEEEDMKDIGSKVQAFASTTKGGRLARAMLATDTG